MGMIAFRGSSSPQAPSCLLPQTFDIDIAVRRAPMLVRVLLFHGDGPMAALVFNVVVVVVALKLVA
jgi:hypothetical protein